MVKNELKVIFTNKLRVLYGYYMLA